MSNNKNEQQAPLAIAPKSEVLPPVKQDLNNPEDDESGFHEVQGMDLPMADRNIPVREHAPKQEQQYYEDDGCEIEDEDIVAEEI